MSEYFNNGAGNERDDSVEHPTTSIEQSKGDVLELARIAIALEGTLKKIGQDCREEPLQYLERTQTWQQGE